ncbi:androgen-induced gene 1 protein-like [Adelges cooleyi]|uniref:androgen-induced gene 1 protein-like n=1 Tax=Adelges cooleyi TaxID=133065 RepID=UPI00217FD613|nr:androgen-induced gene 1 protein-like [Adelges cooleyi]
MFWGLYFLDRNLVMSKYLDVYFPSWLNHTMHTFVSVFACLEMITAYRPYPSRIHGLQITSSYILTYFVWIHIVYSQCNLWVYPILSQLNMFYRTLFFLGLFIHSASLYLIGEYTNLKLWDFQRQKIQEKHQ